MKALIIMLSLVVCLSYDSSAQCHADFTYDINESRVTFHPADSSYGKIHYWAFGDGNAGTNIRETHYYAPGIYTVQHTIHDTVSNCIDSVTTSIQLDYTPVCVSYFSVRSDHPNPNHFSFRQTVDGDVFGIINTTWTVDGLAVASNDYGSDFEYIFAPSTQPHIITMDVETASGCVSTYRDTIRTYQKCDLDISFTYSFSPDDASSVSFIPNDTSMKYHWFSDNYIIAGGPQGNQYRFTAPGNYSVIMRATDSLTSCFDTVSRVVNVADGYNRCTIAMNVSREEGNLLLLSPSSDQPIARQHWSIHTSSTMDTINAPNGNPQQYFILDTGMHIISLSIETNSGCTKQITDTLWVTHSADYSRRTTMNIYPNPANNEIRLTVTAEKDNNASVTIFTAMGKVILKRQEKVYKGENHISIPVIQLPRGQYFIHVQQAGRIHRSSFNKL